MTLLLQTFNIIWVSYFTNNSETYAIMSMIRKSRWKKFKTALFLPVLITIFVAGCEKPTLTLGTNFINNTNTNIVVIDTFSANLSTVVLDSFPTAGSGTMLIGNYNDPYFGNIVSKSIVQIGKPATIPAISSLAVYDSISLIMHINKTFYGDTTKSQRYVVNQLSQIITLPIPPLPQTFYNNTFVSFNPTPLGFSDVITIKPTALITKDLYTKDSVIIRLPDTLGQNLFQLLYTKSAIVTNQTSFMSYFNGLSISADNNSSGVIYGFNDSVMLRLVYHEPASPRNYINVYFPINNAAYQFNQVSINRSATPLAVLKNIQDNRPNKVIPAEAPSTLTNNASYLQPMTGLQVKVLFPSIFSLTQFSDYISILKAELILRPIGGTYSPLLALPPRVTAAQTDQTNQIGGLLVAGSSIQYGNLITDYVSGQNTMYSYDVTNYLKQELSLNNSNTSALQGLMLTVPAPANITGFNRAVFGDKTNKTANAQLIVYYISYPH